MTGARESGGAWRVVVAEDEAIIRMDLVEMLAGEGYDVVGQAPDGLTAVQLVDTLEPDVLVVDIAMPGLDGIEVTREVHARTAVVVVTAFGQLTRVEQARDAGAMAYLVKPVGAADLMPAIEMAAHGWRVLQEARGVARQSQEAVRDAERRLADRRDVERAKGLLQEQHGWTEDRAYRWLRETAMDRRIGLGDLARFVVGEANTP